MTTTKTMVSFCSSSFASPSSSSRRQRLLRRPGRGGGVRRCRARPLPPPTTVPALLLHLLLVVVVVVLVVPPLGAVPVLALDADCQPPGADAYTGYSLKLGSGCEQYVYCTSGVISSWHVCTSGLLFNGGVGVGGICDWPAGVRCAADDDDDIDAAPVVATTTTTTTTIAAPRADDAPTVATDDDNPDDDDDDDNPESYFCGESESDAAALCRPCPTGRMIECSDNFTHGCFRGIASCRGGAWGSSVETPPATATGTGTGTDALAGGAVGDSLAIQDALDDNLDAIVESYQQQEQEREQEQGGDARPDAPGGEGGDDDGDNDDDARPSNNGGDGGGGGGTPIPSISPTLPPYTMAPFAATPDWQESRKTVIGYYASWQWYDRNKLADPINVDFAKYSRINYAFFQPDTAGNLYGTDEWADPQLLFGPYVHDANLHTEDNRRCSWDGPGVRNCNHHDTAKGLLHLAQSRGVEVWPSIGGWTLSDNFPGIAADPELREHFAQQCVDLVNAYGFDGIDIDWEYPGYEDHSGTPADTENFTLLLQAVSDKLKRLGGSYGLTAALPCGPDKIEKIQVSEIDKYLTEFNLMSYDMHGAWDTLTGTNAPMFDQGWGDKTRRWSTHGCVETYVEFGIKNSKINIGLPFYGRSFQKATGMKEFHGGADDINYHLDEGSPQYFNIVNELGRMTTYRHEATQTQYAVFNDGEKGLVSYDDARAICDKVHYANERGLNGFLVWELSGDMIDMGDGNIVTPLIDAANAKISNPNLDCSGLGDPDMGQTSLIAPDEPEIVDWSNYVAPISMGSANDFNGAQEGEQSIPAPIPSFAVSADSESSPSTSGEACPLDYTGYYATARCEAYVYCTEGEIVGAVLPCVPGTLFDVTIGVCTWADAVQCGS